ncbi:hypothetical protein EDB82DRAFT_522889 [Fusarium venenatum]|nr:hypothetical protein EDB82DRAFT_522889 [Fusarium venenatum]
MELRWLILSFFFFTTSFANNNGTSTNNSTGETELFGENPYWDEVDRPCVEEWMPMCYEPVEGYLSVPILCICGQDSSENDFLIAFAQCLGEDGLTQGEINDAFVA